MLQSEVGHGFCGLVGFTPQEVFAFVFELLRLDFVDFHVAHVDDQVARAELQQQRIEFLSGLERFQIFGARESTCRIALGIDFQRILSLSAGRNSPPGEAANRNVPARFKLILRIRISPAL